MTHEYYGPFSPEYMSSANVTEHFSGAQSDSAENAASLYVFLGTAAVFGLLAVRYVSSLLSLNNQVATAVEEVEAEVEKSENQEVEAAVVEKLENQEVKAAFEKVLADLKKRGKKEAAAALTINTEKETSNSVIPFFDGSKMAAFGLDVVSYVSRLFSSNDQEYNQAAEELLNIDPSLFEDVEYDQAAEELLNIDPSLFEDKKDNQLQVFSKMLDTRAKRDGLGAAAGAIVGCVVGCVVAGAAAAAVWPVIVAIIGGAAVGAILTEFGCAAVSSWTQKVEAGRAGPAPEVVRQ